MVQEISTRDNEIDRLSGILNSWSSNPPQSGKLHRYRQLH